MSEAIDWRRAWRLTLAGVQWGGWQGWVLLILLVLLVSLTNISVLHNQGWAPLAGFQMTAIGIFLLYGNTGSANAGWRYLPVTSRDRRAAAWLTVAVLPLALVAVTAAVSLGLASLRFGDGHRVDAWLALAMFGVEGVLAQIMALVLLVFANWPISMQRYWQPGQRALRDWLVYIPSVTIMLGGMLKGGELIHMPGIAVPAAMAALLLCGLGLGAALHMIRLDTSQVDQDGLGDTWVPDLHLTGVSGHLIGQGMRVAGITALLLALGQIFDLAIPAIVPLRPDMAQGLRAGIGIWNHPAPLALIMVMINLQSMLRQRRLILSLPHGRALMLLHPLFVATLAFAMACVVHWRDVSAHMQISAIAFVFVLALAYVYLALNLRATRMIEIMLSGMIAGIPVGFVVFLAIDTASKGTFGQIWGPTIALASLCVLALALAACVHGVNTSRRPYRPWPVAVNRWRGA
jgi:hypothetical protein